MSSEVEDVVWFNQASGMLVGVVLVKLEADLGHKCYIGSVHGQFDEAYGKNFIASMGARLHTPFCNAFFPHITDWNEP